MTFIAFNIYSANQVKLIYRSFLWAKSPSTQSRSFWGGVVFIFGVSMWQRAPASPGSHPRLKFMRKFNLSELREPLFFFLNSEASSWPPESKPDVLIRTKDNKLQIEILSMADHQRTGLQNSLNAWNSSPMHINAQQILSPLSSHLGWGASIL